MPVIKIETWTLDSTKRRQLQEGLTREVHTILGVPLNKITVIVAEFAAEAWSDAGIPGSDPDFREKSGRTVY